MRAAIVVCASTTRRRDAYAMIPIQNSIVDK